MQLSSKARKAMAAGLAASTILWASIGLIPSFAAAAVHTEGCLVLSGGVVWMITNSTRRGFTSAEVFQSWGYNFSQVVTATTEDVALPVGPIMTYADGTLVKGPSDPLVYLVTNGQKRGFVSGSVFTGLGFSFSNVQSAPANTFADLSTGANLDSSAVAHPAGVKVISNGAIWLMGTSGRMGFSSMANFSSFGYNLAHVVAANSYDLAMADQGAVASRPGCSTTGTTTPPVSGALSVSLAASTPVATSVIADTTSGDGAQALIPFLSVNFTAGSAASVVTTVTVKRTGISSNSDLSNIYLYDGSTRLAEYNSYSDGVATFTNSSGLFTVPANSSRVVTVKADLANGTSSGKTISLTLTSVALSGGASVSGLPLVGNQMTTATVADLGKLTINTFTSFPATIDPGLNDQEVWRFNLVSADQIIEVSKLNLTLVGTVATTDLQNIKLKYSGVQVGSTVQVASDNSVLFDLSASPISLTSGQTKTITVHADIVGGTSRSFKFTIRKSSDIAAKDMNYGVSLKPNQTDTLAIIEPETGNGTDINSGTVTVTKASDSPTGNVTAASTGVTLAKFNIKASGEAVKISTIIVGTVLTVSGDDAGLDNGKLFVDGSQVGTTTDLDTDNTAEATFVDTATASPDDDTTFSLGNTFIIPAGVTKVLTVVADTKDATGGALTAASTIKVSVGGMVATGQVSLATITIASSDANTVTTATGALTEAINNAMSSATVANPTGVKGATNVKIGSFVLTAGTGEGVSVTQIVVGDDPGDATSDFGANFQNLRMMYGSTQIGVTQGELSDTEGVDFTFNASPAFTIAAGQQAVIDMYADILTNAANYATAEVGLEYVSVSATGAVTGSSASDATAADLQSLVIASTGSVTVSANSSQPVAGQLIMGESDVTLAMFDFEAGSAEDLQITKIIVTDSTTTPNEFGGSLSNLKLFNGSTQVGSTVTSLSLAVDGTATFNLTTPLVLPRNATTTLTLKGSVNAYPNAVSGGTHSLAIVHATDDVLVIGASSGAAIAETVSSAAGTAQDIYRTKATVALNSASPSGATSESATQEVFRFDVAANSAYDAVVNAVAVTLSGNALLTSSGNANLYKSTDLNTALATEGYQTLTFADNSGGDGGAELTFQVIDVPTDCDGIPVGSTIRVDDGGTYVTGNLVVTVVDSVTGGDCTITFTKNGAAYTVDLDDADILYYRPLQPGTGKLFFGAQTTLTADEANGSTSLNVTSTAGFSTGDTVTVTGYSGTGVATASTAGGVITAIPDATTLTVTAVTLAATIDYDYTSGSTANALTKNHNSAATVTAGLINTSGQTVAAGTTLTFVVKGDTTGANASSTATETITAALAAVGDFTWDDKTSFGIITDTKNIPVNGGTLSY